jgi:hypothetical protein
MMRWVNHLIMMGCRNEDHGTVSWDVECTTGTNFAKEDGEDHSG